MAGFDIDDIREMFEEDMHSILAQVGVLEEAIAPTMSELTTASHEEARQLFVAFDAWLTLEGTECLSNEAQARSRQHADVVSRAADVLANAPSAVRGYYERLLAAVACVRETLQESLAGKL